MSRENILFGVVGLLLGYVIAFHLVVHINQTQSQVASASASSSSDSLPGGHTNVAGDDSRSPQQLKAAAEAAARAADQSPKDFDAQVKAAATYMDADEYEKATGFLQRATELQPENLDVRSELAVAYFMHDPPQGDKAVAELRRNLQTDPNHLPSLHNLTRMLVDLGKLDEAEATLAKLEKVKPDYEQLPQLRAEIEKARRGPSSNGTRAGGAKKSPTD
jgi:tetratricopeptide (TPR) repeat protein